MLVHRSLTFHCNTDSTRLNWLMSEFRLLVNRSIRVALQSDIRSRAKLSSVAYARFSQEHAIYKQYISAAFAVALGQLKGHRKRLKHGRLTSTPYVRRPMLQAENQSYSLDRQTGRLRIPIQGTQGIQVDLPLSSWHRSYLADESWSLGSLTMVPGTIIIRLRKGSPTPLPPSSVFAYDTNEDTLDGIFASLDSSRVIGISLDGVRAVQAVHFRRQRRLARKKKHDRRVLKSLVRREGRRQRNRVVQRLHRVSRLVVRTAQIHHSAVVIEKLAFRCELRFSRRMNRRLSSWPRGELHRQIEYKAALAGVPIIKVNPAWTSKTCPVCGARRRDRVGQDFVCLMCDWEMDRQHNAACNILLSALASSEALARAVRFRPGALRNDVVSPLYAIPALLGGSREEPSGVESSRETAA